MCRQLTPRRTLEVSARCCALVALFGNALSHQLCQGRTYLAILAHVSRVGRAQRQRPTEAGPLERSALGVMRGPGS